MRLLANRPRSVRSLSGLIYSVSIRRQYAHTRKSLDDLPKYENSKPLPLLRRSGKPKYQDQEPLWRKENHSSPHPDELKSSLAKEVATNLRAYPNCLLLTHVGDFWESYFDQAIEISRLLNLVLTKKEFDGGIYPFAGFPLPFLPEAIRRLVRDKHRSVAICEEFKVPKPNGIDFDIQRKVIRIITPGTLLDEPFLDPRENNYLLSIYEYNDNNDNSTEKLGLAWVDVATGDFYTETLLSTDLDLLCDFCYRINPKEIIITAKTIEGYSVLKKFLEQKGYYVAKWRSNTSQDSTNDASLLLSSYISSTIIGSHPVLKSSEEQPHETQSDRKNTMHLNSTALRGLDIVQTNYEGGTKGSLLNIVDRTQTKGGHRLLFNRLVSPSTCISTIKERQAIVTLFRKEEYLMEDVRLALKNHDDPLRNLQKINVNRAKTKDFFKLSNSLKDHVGKVKQILDSQSKIKKQKEIDQISSNLVEHQDICTEINNALLPEKNDDKDLPDEESSPATQESPTPNIQHKGLQDEIFDESAFKREWVIQPSYTKDLANEHANLQKLDKKKSRIENSLKKKLGTNSSNVWLTWHNSYGAVVQISGKNNRLEDQLDNVNLISRDLSKAIFYLPEWEPLYDKMSESLKLIKRFEKQAFNTLRDKIMERYYSLRKSFNTLYELDVHMGFAVLSLEQNQTLPEINEGTDLYIENGRHPVTEYGLLLNGVSYVPNSIHLSQDDKYVHLITGPNMGGKSTHIRMAALIVLLAQVGAYVPADRALIGICDGIFTRISSSDNIYEAESSYMVEMREASEIIQKATEKSLVIMDEVGRGTAVADGAALSFATIDYLLRRTKSRSLVATHFHELSTMFGQKSFKTISSPSYQVSPKHKGIGFYQSEVHELQGSFHYTFKFNPGFGYQSHGIRSAELANVPCETLDIATKTYQMLVSRRQNARQEMAEQTTIVNPVDRLDLSNN